MARRLGIAAILTTYAVACGLPAVAFRADDRAILQLPTDDLRGYQCLLAAPLALQLPAWNANPLFFAGCVALACRRDRLATWLGGIAAALGASYLWFADNHNYPPIRIGFFVWMASLLGLMLAGELGRRRAGLEVTTTAGHDASPASAIGSSLSS